MRTGVAVEQAQRSAFVVQAWRVGCSITGGHNGTGAVVEGQWSEPIADVELSSFLAALERVVSAAEVLFQQRGADAEHPRSDRQALGFIAVQQFAGYPVERGGELPAQVVGVLHTGVEALAAGRRV